jgi:hypothetical protein
MNTHRVLDAARLRHLCEDDAGTVPFRRAAEGDDTISQKLGPYHVVDLPAARRDSPNFFDMFWWKHFIYGLLEVDVTIARQFIAEHKARTGEALSLPATWLSAWPAL